MRIGSFRPAALSLLVVGLATPALAQDSGARVSGLFAASFGEGHTAIETGGAVGYRFTRHIGFDLEFLALPDLEFEEPDVIIAARRRFTGTVFPPPVGFNDTGRVVAFLANFVAEFPAPGGRIIPYVEGGGGAANVSRTIRLTPLFGVRDIPGLRNIAGTRPVREDDNLTLDFERAETNLALTTGGGVDFQLWRGLAVGGNVRYMRLLGNTDDLNLTRVGARVSYRF